MIGLVDCNNFFVSCERVFRPSLRGRPVVVLSNNDGCIISRSNEAKAMGIQMGEPLFKVKHLVDSGKLEVCSSNYTLYGDMSRRVMSVLRGEVPHLEIYSIDECLIDVEGIANLKNFGSRLARKVQKWTGIPVSIGIAPTKTLAKVASKFAKRYVGYEGCCLIDTEVKREKALRLFPIKDVWGIGRRYGAKLQAMGVNTAFDFSLWQKGRVCRMMGMNGVRTWTELHGIPTSYLELPAAKKTITTSRSFKTEIDNFEQLETMIVDYSAHCARKLREQKSCCYGMSVYISSNRFHEEQNYYKNMATVRFEVPTSDMREMASAASAALKTIFCQGIAYKKAGVTVTDIVNGGVQTHMYDTVDRLKQERLLSALDSLRSKHGNRVVKIAMQGDYNDNVNRNFCSPCYTTNPNDLIKVRLG